MSLVCSLVGHDWGEERVETEREEARGQVVVTEREYRECVRCGERNVISENTEVRPAKDNQAVADEEGADEAATEAETEETSTFAPSDGYDTEETEDAAIIDEGGKEASDAEGGAGEAGAETDEAVQDRVRESTGTEVTRETTRDEEDDYVCPECGFSSSNPSRREGDLCPECREGYLEETAP
jgi:DNA-directed RNA polymerase subunit RPC12/RpoP